MKSLFLSVGLCAFGLFYHFKNFWSGFDAISGDPQDASFIALALEHTWLWATGVHADLFTVPFYFPHANVYAMSEYFFSASPIYWVFRAAGLEMYLSYQAWILSCCVLNFVAFMMLARRVSGLGAVTGAFGAYVFTFALPRMMQVGHSQLIPQFFVLLSAIGLVEWWRTPASRRGPLLFFVGGALQLLTSFYFFWFWCWTLAIYFIYLMSNRERREGLSTWAQAVNRKWVIGVMVGCLCFTSPFFYHYILAVQESGFRSWIAIVESVPAPYAWLAVPTTHWQWPYTPFHNWILDLKGLHEKYLSFGLVTWIAMIAALFQTWRTRQLRWLAVPLVAMLLLTMTSGRFSTWVLVAYLLPAGRAVRAVSRIQVFMLMFWALIYVAFLRVWWQSGNRPKRAAVGFFVLMFFLENTFYEGPGSFSAASEEARISKLAQQILSDCEVIYAPAGFGPVAHVPSLDAMRVAYRLNIKTINGYTGQLPREFAEVFHHAGTESRPVIAKLDAWMQAHGQSAQGIKFCELKHEVAQP